MTRARPGGGDRTLARAAGLALAGLAATALTACSPAGQAAARAGSASPRPAASDPPTVSALLRIAQTFNNEYDNGDFGAVYGRWDPRSQALISRAEYIRRHLLCAPATHEVATVEGASPAGGAPGSASPGSASPGSSAPGSSAPGSSAPAQPAGGRAWHVRYEIGGQQLTDTWHYVGGRWVFDIIASNPGAARLYRMPFQRYVAAVGCSTH